MGLLGPLGGGSGMPSAITDSCSMMGLLGPFGGGRGTPSAVNATPSAMGLLGPLGGGNGMPSACSVGWFLNDVKHKSLTEIGPLSRMRLVEIKRLEVSNFLFIGHPPVAKGGSV